MSPAAALCLAAFCIFSSAPAASRPGPPTPIGPIAFSSYRHGRLDIYSMEADGGGVRNLTRDAAPDFQPAWSPDGRVIAFVSLHTDLSHFDQIFTIEPASGERRQLTEWMEGTRKRRPGHLTDRASRSMWSTEGRSTPSCS